MNFTIVKFAAIVVWSGFILVTVRKFWRPDNDESQFELYREVRVGGPLLTALFSLVTPITVNLPMYPYWPEVVFWAVLFFPVTMWFTYVGFRLFYAIVNSQ